MSGLIRGALGALLLAQAAAAFAQTSSGGNGYYDVAVDIHGEYTARSGNLHSQPRANIFYGGEPLIPSSTWNSVRSYRSNKEWVLLDTTFGQPFASPGFTCAGIWTEDRASSAYLRNADDVITGVQHSWIIRAEDLEVVQEIQAEGVTQETSVVRVTLCVRNTGTVDAPIGIRFLWDWQIAFGNFGYIGPRPPSPPVEPLIDTEQDFPSPAFTSYDVTDSPNPSVAPPTYYVGGTVSQPILARGPTQPELMQYAAWWTAANTCFDYALQAPPEIIGDVDSALTYYWGATPSTPIVIPPNGEFCATQYVYLFQTVPPPICPIDLFLTHVPTCASDVTLDASRSFSSSCAGPLEFRFRDPAGAITEDWSTDPRSTADSQGRWGVDVRCSTDPACIASVTEKVRIDRPPVLDATATDIASCGPLGIQLDWTATYLGSTGTGLVNVYRSEISCADAESRPPIVACTTAAGTTDTATAAGATYYYVIEAEDADAATLCAPAGSCNGGATTRTCVGPVTDVAGGPVPPGMCWMLRVGHSTAADDDVTLDWSGSRALTAGEHFHVLKTTLDPRNPLAHVNGEGDTTLAYTENDATAWLQFFDVRIASACEIESGDDELPWSGGALPTCP